MRAFVFLLVLANLLFGAWTHGYLGRADAPDVPRVSNELEAERLVIVARDEPPPRSEKAKNDKAAKPGKNDESAREAGNAPEVCLKVVDVPAEPAVAFVEALGEKVAAFRIQRTAQPGSASYWVYIPPANSRKEADSKAAELKKLGVPEFFVVQDGPYARAISLGIFSSKEAANARHEQLRGKGVRSAKVGERPGKPALFDLVLSGPEGQLESVRKLLADRLSDYPAAACKAANGAP